MREIITRWSVPTGGPGVTVMYFDDSVSGLAAERLALQDLWEAFAFQVGTGVTWEIEQESRTINEATGNMTGIETDPIVMTFSGTGGEPLPNAAQMLIRWRTSDVVGGRILQGRQFVPAPGLAVNQDGEVATAVKVSLDTAIENFLIASQGFGVWHRPTDSSVGSHHLATAGSLWEEFAVLRQRRS